MQFAVVIPPKFAVVVESPSKVNVIWLSGGLDEWLEFRQCSHMLIMHSLNDFTHIQACARFDFNDDDARSTILVFNFDCDTSNIMRPHCSAGVSAWRHTVAPFLSVALISLTSQTTYAISNHTSQTTHS